MWSQIQSKKKRIILKEIPISHLSTDIKASDADKIDLKIKYTDHNLIKRFFSLTLNIFTYGSFSWHEYIIEQSMIECDENKCYLDQTDAFSNWT